MAIATIGIPLPIPVVKDMTAAFPCMNCGCGCLNAEMCWRQCCCFTKTQKIAWAENNGVRIPAYLAQSKETDVEVRLADLKPCCRARYLAREGKDECRRSADEGKVVVVPGVLAIHALKCQGNSLTVSLLPPSIPMDRVGTDLELSPTDSLALVESLTYQPPFFDAVVPPPEFAVL